MAESAIRDTRTAKAFIGRRLIAGWVGNRAIRVPCRRSLSDLKISENHLRDLMDWLEEIALRDGIISLQYLNRPAIDSIKTDPRLGRADKLKRIKEQAQALEVSSARCDRRIDSREDPGAKTASLRFT